MIDTSNCKAPEEQINAVDLDSDTVALLEQKLSIKLAWLVAACSENDDVLVLGVPKEGMNAATFPSQKSLIRELFDANAQWQLRGADHLQVIRIAASPVQTLISVPNPISGSCIWVKISLP